MQISNSEDSIKSLRLKKADEISRSEVNFPDQYGIEKEEQNWYRLSLEERQAKLSSHSAEEFPDPFESEEERRLYREFLKRKLAWTHSPEFDLFVDYDRQYEKEHGII